MRDPIAHVDRYLPRSLIERVRTTPTTQIKAPRYIVERCGRQGPAKGAGQMYKRGLSRALDQDNVRELVAAEQFAFKRGKPLTGTINSNPKLLDSYPDDVGRWVGWLTNKIRIHCERAGFGYFAIWVRENYVGSRREHFHMMLHLPERERAALEDALRRWLPGKEAVVYLGRPESRVERHRRKVNKALTYMLKQMTPQAWWSLGKAVRREKRCSKTHELVATVLGRRSGTSRSLNANTRKTFWATTHCIATASTGRPSPGSRRQR